MDAVNSLSRVFRASEEIPFDDSSRIVLVSDCHRGDGSWADDFAKNQYIYCAALSHYYDRGYTYIEIGDGDELWKNKSFSDIVRVHGDVFWLLSMFFSEGRLYSIFGNHDIVKGGIRPARNYYCMDRSYLRGNKRRDINLLNNVTHREGLVLRHTPTGGSIFLVHGHQADYFNYKMWKFGRFLVRYIWKPLELYGVNDPTSAAKNNDRTVSVERKLIEWVTSNNQVLVAGHTHRPVFPEPGEPPYFNDGSCVHPYCITALELADGQIVLVKWEVKSRRDGSLFVGREVLAGPRKLSEYLGAGALLQGPVKK